MNCRCSDDDKERADAAANTSMANDPVDILYTVKTVEWPLNQLMTWRTDCTLLYIDGGTESNRLNCIGSFNSKRSIMTKLGLIRRRDRRTCTWKNSEIKTNPGRMSRINL